MAKRLKDTEIWDKEWFMSLDPTIKCLVDYVRDKCDMAGVWDPNWTLANTYIKGKTKVTEKDLLSVDGGKQFIKIDGGKIFCLGFTSFQYGEKLNEKSPVHNKVIGILKKHHYNGNTLFNTLSNTLFNTLSNTPEEEDKEEEEEKEEVKEEEEVNESFENFWEEYDKKVGDKAKLKKKWNSLSEIDRKNALEYITAYKKAQPDKKYRKNPETFLNQKSWNDELIDYKNKTPPTLQEQKFDGIIHILQTTENNAPWLNKQE